MFWALVLEIQLAAAVWFIRQQIIFVRKLKRSYVHSDIKANKITLYRFACALHLPHTQVLQRNNPDWVFILQEETDVKKHTAYLIDN